MGTFANQEQTQCVTHICPVGSVVTNLNVNIASTECQACEAGFVSKGGQTTKCTAVATTRIPVASPVTNGSDATVVSTVASTVL